MKKRVSLLVYSLVILLFSICVFSQKPVYADEKLDSLIKECGIVFEEITEMPEGGIPDRLLKNVTGIAIFPSTIKGAFIIGARYGEGVVLYKNPETGKWSPPAFFTVSGASFGWQAGGEAIDLIFVIPTERGFEGMLKNKFSIGTNSALVAGPVGRHAELGADIALKGGIFTYSRAKGLFAGLGLKGIAISPDKAANSLYYGPNLTTRDILIHKKAKPTPSAKKLIKIISDHVQ